MNLKALVFSGLTISATIFGLSNIAANCQPPPASTVVTVEGWICAIAESIPPIAGYATYICSVIGQNGKTTATLTVRVPLNQVAAFEKAHPIVRPSDAGK